MSEDTMSGRLEHAQDCAVYDADGSDSCDCGYDRSRKSKALREVMDAAIVRQARYDWCDANAALIGALMSGEPTGAMVRAAAESEAYPSVYMGGPTPLQLRAARLVLIAAFKAATRPQDGAAEG